LVLEKIGRPDQKEEDNQGDPEVVHPLRGRDGVFVSEARKRKAK
jgi:hypothetical protein